MTPRERSGRKLYHYQRKCPGCGAWLPVEPKGSKEENVDGDTIYEFLWICVNCGSGWSSEGVAKRSEYTWLGPAKSNLRAGPRLAESFGDEPEETLEPQEPGSFDPGPVKDPTGWKNANALTADQANLIRAAWEYLDAIRGSDWLAEVHLVWNLENALIDQDIRQVIEATRVYLTETGEGSVSSNESKRWEPALRDLKRATKQAIRKRRPTDEGVQIVSARLNRLLEWLLTSPVHSHVIVRLSGSDNYYVQFALAEGQTVIAEAVSNTFLGPEEQLSRRKVKRLLELGWNPPEVDSAQQADLEGKFAHFYRVWRHPVPIGEAVNLAVQTAFEVYGATDSWEFEYETWMHGHDEANN